MDYFKYGYSQRLDIHMKQRVLPLTRIFAAISIIMLVITFSACAEESTIDNSDIPYVEDILDSVGTELVHEEFADEKVTLFTGILPFDAETVIIIADSNVVYEVNAATPLGRLAIAALEGDGFEYVVSDERFESDGILTLVSIEGYLNGEIGTWKAYGESYDGNNLIADEQVNTLLVADAVIFVYSNDNERTIAVVEILAEPLVDEVNTASPEVEVTPEPIAELDEQ
jgi:hypothetical protein